MDTTWLTVLWIVQDIAMVVALVIFATTSRAGRKKFEMIGWLLTVGILAETASTIGYYGFRANVNWFNTAYDLFVTPIYFLFYKTKINSLKTIAVMRILMFASIAFTVINALFIQGVDDIGEYSKAFGAFVLMIYALIYFYTLMKDLPTQLVTRLPMFWINASVLIYYANMFLIYLLTEYVLTVLKGSIIITWMVHNIIGIAHYAMLSIGLWSNRSLYLPRSHTY